jgi:membrane dipeptidase
VILSAGAQRLEKLVDGGLVWDNHGCMPLRPDDSAFFDELLRCRSAGIDCITLNIGFGDDGIEQHIRMLAHFRAWIARHSEEFQLILRPNDLTCAKATGRLGVCFDIEGMNALGNQVSMVRLYYDLGVRWMLIAYNVANPAGGGCLEDDRGLTMFGREVIEEMNAVGMVICCTHTGYRTARQAIDASKDPVIFSHSNARAIWDHPRNIPDDLMLACAARGGVIGLNGFGQFLGDNDDSTETFVRHVEHVLSVVGDDHVGLGLDYMFDQNELAELMAARPAFLPAGAYGEAPKMIPPWRLPEIAQALSDRGCGTATLAKIMGGNFQRIARSVWRSAET